MKARAADSTRQRLQKIDLLHPDADKAPGAASDAGTPGYNEDQRQEMQNLIQQEGRTNE